MSQSVKPDGVARGPEEAQSPRVSPPPSSAAGFAAVVSSLRHAWDEMGVSRGLRALLRVNQKNGYDCQSCAWPNPDDDRHTAEFCESGAKAVADEATLKRIDRRFFATHAISDLAQRPDHWLNDQGRLTEPMWLPEGATRYQPITWPAAIARIAAKLQSLDSPHRAVFYTSGRTSNEAAFLYQLFVRKYGTNNMPDCSNMCHESSGTALNETIGIGKGTVTLRDFEHAEMILILGQNPGTNHPRMLTALQDAARRGAHIVTINPLREVGTVSFRNPQELRGLAGLSTAIATEHIPVRIRGDMALLKGLMKALLELDRAGDEVIAHEFIASHTEGFEALEQDLECSNWDELETSSGVSRATIEALAGRIAASERIICTWAMGLTQHPEAVATIQQISNLLLMKGSIGKAGVGLCPVRGHSNVQGDRTMGIWERPRSGFLDALEQEFGFEPPREHGYDTVDSIRAMARGEVDVFFALGGNFLSATPDTDYTAAALRRCALTVQVSTKLNRAHLVHGREAIILPCLGRTDIDLQDGKPQFVTVEDSMGIVSASRGLFEPASPELKSEVRIVAELAAAVTGESSGIDWNQLADDYDRIRDRIARVIPGFEDFNNRIREGSFYLPNDPREGRFSLEGGRARFVPAPLPIELLHRPEELLMMTVRTHDQFNTTVYGLDDRYRGIHDGRRIIFMNGDDIRERGLSHGDLVDIVSDHGGRTRVAPSFRVVEYEIPRRCVATYFPEGNVLVPIDHVAARSNTPASKSVVVSVRPSAQESGGQEQVQQ